VPRPTTDEPLNFPLTFTLTDKALAKPGSATLGQGNYKAIALRTYEQHQRCDGCNTKDKAKQLVVVKEDLTGNTHEVGLQCMADMYAVDIRSLNDHTQTVSKTRINLKAKLGLKGDLSTERMLEIVREALVTYLQVPGRYLHELDEFDIWTLGPQETARIMALHQLACYHREWQEDPSRAHQRWRALRAHPAFSTSQLTSEVEPLCDRALSAANLLSETDVLRLNTLLDEASKFKQRQLQLTRPEEHATREAYEEALERKVQGLVALGMPLDVRLNGDGTSHKCQPQTLVGLTSKTLYAVAGVWEDEVETFADRLKQFQLYWRRYRRPVIFTGPPDQEDFPKRTTRTLNAITNQWEESTLEEAWSFQYRRVAWAVLEQYTETHRLWHLYGRDRLERYL